jgi:hypothetical protein
VISIKFEPARSGMLAIAQLVMPLATPLTPFAPFSHTTRVMADDAEPVRLMLDCVVEKDVPVVGVQIATVAVLHPVGGGGVGDVGGGVVVVTESERVTTSLSTLGFPAASYAVISITFIPA